MDDTELATIARSVAKYPIRIDEFREQVEIRAQQQKQIHEAQWNRETAAREQSLYPSMPSSALASTRLQDIYGEVFQPSGWTLDFALPALVTAASVIVPRFVAPEGQFIPGDDNLVNLFTALIGDVHCGKSQIMQWAAKAMGIYKEEGARGVRSISGLPNVSGGFPENAHRKMYQAISSNIWDPNTHVCGEISFIEWMAELM